MNDEITMAMTMNKTLFGLCSLPPQRVAHFVYSGHDYCATISKVSDFPTMQVPTGHETVLTAAPVHRLSVHFLMFRGLLL